MTIGHGLFLGAALLGVALTLITEGLSLLGGVTRGWLVVSWALVAGIGLWAQRRHRADPTARAPALPIPRLALGAVGIVLAVILIFVINRRSFGWTLEVALAPGVLLGAVALAVAAAIAAGIYPALRMARTPPAVALRDE